MEIPIIIDNSTNGASEEEYPGTSTQEQIRNMNEKLNSLMALVLDQQEPTQEDEFVLDEEDIEDKRRDYRRQSRLL